MTGLPALVDGDTRVFGIVGHPIAQVRSPQVMTARLRAAGRNAVLVPLHVPPEGFEDTVRALMRLHNLDGLVVTVPFKPRALALADIVHPNAARVGAANALRRGADGRWEADMFDGAGLVRALRGQNVALSGARVIMLGAGGAGSAVAIALAEAGAARLLIHDVEAGRAASLARRVAEHFPGCDARPGTAPTALSDTTLLVNCSPIGMAPGDGMPAPFGPLDPALFVVDIIMQPEETPLLAHARACGCRAMNGRPMLENQADAVIEFFGVPSPSG